MVRLQILGIGCDTCDKLAENAAQAARELGLDYELVRVTRIEEIKPFRVIVLPALVVDGIVKSVGVSLNVESVKRLLSRP
jgi:small redox-active disulfide protein 2